MKQHETCVSLAFALEEVLVLMGGVQYRCLVGTSIAGVAWGAAMWPLRASCVSFPYRIYSGEYASEKPLLYSCDSARVRGFPSGRHLLN